MKSDPTDPRQPRFRFNLTSMLILTTLVGLVSIMMRRMIPEALPGNSWSRAFLTVCVGLVVYTSLVIGYVVLRVPSIVEFLRRNRSSVQQRRAEVMDELERIRNDSRRD